MAFPDDMVGVFTLMIMFPCYLALGEHLCKQDAEQQQERMYIYMSPIPFGII